MNFPWKKRDDLMIQPHDTGGWLIKDPISLQYTLLSSLEYQVFQKLDGLSDLRSVFTTGSGSKLTSEDLESFLSHLIKRQLLFRPAGGDAERFSSLKPKTASPLTLMTRLLSWYVPLGNPRSLLSRLEAINTVVFHRRFIQLCVVLFVMTIFVLGLNFNVLVTEVSQLAGSFTHSSVVSVLFILIMVKLAHELGHALSARHYGSDCHEAGILFLFLTPVPFTNVTDSWRLPAAQRMIVTGAGIIVELFIASSCIILWSVTTEGLTHNLLLQTAIVCSVNTLLFNGNPLLRFDGYFLLSDFLRIPNLAPRSFDLIRSLCVSFLTGQPVRTDDEKGRHKTMITYGVLACFYRVFLAFSILEAIHFLCASNDLRVLSWLLKLLTMVVLLGLPLARLLQAIVSRPLTSESSATDDDSANRHSNGWKKGLGQTTILVITLGAVFFTPLPSRVVSLATVTPSQQRIFAGISGRLSGLSIPKGNHILPESWRLTKVESQSTILSLRAEQQLASLQLQIAKRTQRTGSGPSIQELQKAVESAEHRLADFQLTITGQSHPVTKRNLDFISDRRFQPDTEGSFNEDWSGLALSPQNLGAWIQQGTTLGYVRSDEPILVIAWVPQAEIQKINSGQPASFRLSAGDAQPQKAIVKNISRFPADYLPLNIAISGNLRGETTELGFRPDDTFYAVTIQLQDHKAGNQLPRHGVGHASVRVKRHSLANRLYDYLRRTFLFSGS